MTEYPLTLTNTNTAAAAQLNAENKTPSLKLPLMIYPPHIAEAKLTRILIMLIIMTEPKKNVRILHLLFCMFWICSLGSCVQVPDPKSHTAVLFYKRK